MESADTVSATAWYLLRSECMFHVAKRIPGEEGTDGRDDGGGGGGEGGRETDGQWGSSSFPNVPVRRTYFGRHISDENKTFRVQWSSRLETSRIERREARVYDKHVHMGAAITGHTQLQKLRYKIQTASSLT